MFVNCGKVVNSKCLDIAYLHRNVRPSNFNIGRPELKEQRKVYIHDFNMSRKFRNKKGAMRKPREAASFRGSVRFAPIACHMQREQCRKDEIEAWVYMIIELTTGSLPWKHLSDRDSVGDCKRRYRTEPFIKELFNGCPQEYMKILQYIDSLTYYDAPDYQMCYELMRRALASMKGQEFPYDWETSALSGMLLLMTTPSFLSSSRHLPS